MGQVLTAVLATIASDQEEKVFEALRRSSDVTLDKRDQSSECGVKEEVTTDQLSILLEVYHEAESRQTR